MPVAYTRAEKLPEALENCDKAFNYATDNSGKARALVLKGKALMSVPPVDGKRISQAEDAFRSAAKLEGNEPVFHLNLAIVMLRESKDDEAHGELQKCFSLNPPAGIADEAKKLLANPQRARQDNAPDFKLATLQGQEVSLQDLRGMVVVLDFWATWCGACRESVGELRDLTKKYPAEKARRRQKSGPPTA